MPGQELRLGPFLGGLNLFSDPSSVADTEMVSCINFEVGLEGSLVSRPPVTQFQATAPSATSNIKILLLAILGGTTYLIGSNGQGVYQSTGGAWTLLGGTVQSDFAVQYNNKVWFFPKIGTTNGATWDGTTYTVITTLPACTAGLVYKERVWIVPGPPAGTNTARLQYSLTADPNSWNTGDATFIDIQPGDGKKLVDIVVYQDNIMLFKEDSTYVLSFDSVPSSATLKRVNPTIGVSGSYSVVSFENSVFVFHRDAVYEIVNYHWTKLNVKVPFPYDATLPASPVGATFAFTHFLTIFGDRLVFRYYKKLYSFGIRTRTWTEFQISTVNNEHWFGPLTRWPSSGNLVMDVYYGGSCIANDVRTYKMQNGYDNTTTESATINCSMLTKNFDSAYGRRYRIFSFGQRFKKMHWWGATVYTSQSVTGIVTPIVTNFSVTWSQAKVYTWQQLGTWQRPLVNAPSITQTWTNPGTLASHFVKFPKSLRYRQVNFQIQMQTDGTLLTGPAKLFGIINTMEVKQVVPEGSN